MYSIYPDISERYDDSSWELNENSSLWKDCVLWCGGKGGGTQAIDSSGRGNHGALIGATWAHEFRRKVVACDINKYVALGDLRNCFGTEATLSLWVRMVSDPPNKDRSGGWDIQTSTSYTRYPYIDGTIYCGTFRVVRETVGDGLVSDMTQWHHVVITTRPGANGWRFFQNGQLAYSATGEATVSVKAASYVGYSRDYLSGAVADIGLWSRVLSDGEITMLGSRRPDLDGAIRSTSPLWVPSVSGGTPPSTYTPMSPFLGPLAGCLGGPI